MTSERVKHQNRPGLLVAERRHWTLLNLDDGEFRPVEFDQLAEIWSSPELQVVPGKDIAQPVRSVALERTAMVDPSRLYVVNGPTVLRLDSGRILSWSYEDSVHVELTEAHLRVLEALRRPARLSDIDSHPGDESILGQLLAISLVVETFEDPDAEANPDVINDSIAFDLLTTAATGSSKSAGEPDREVAEVGVAVAVDGGAEAGGGGLAGTLKRFAAGGRRAVRKRGPLKPDAAGHDAPRNDTTGPGATGHDSGAVVDSKVSPVPAASPAPASGKVPVIPLYRWPMIGQNSGVMMQVEPSLSTGMIFAAARQYLDGKLLHTYDLRKLRPDAFEVLEEWERNPVPAVFAFSDYLWNTEVHLQLSERVKQASPRSICIHGGPNVPKYEEELRLFFRDNPAVDMVAHGEGEITFSEILDILDGELEGKAPDRLADVAGISFRSTTGPGSDDYEIITTNPRSRSADLAEFPSPYLTGEFDDLLGTPWRSASFETNRGCPYGCTFCDWGSNTNSRIRKFDLDRIKDEMTWAIEKGAPADIYVADANVGIFARDVEIAEHIASLRRDYGLPFSMTFSLAKNTVKYSKEIIRIIVQAGILPMTATSAVQSVDPATLRAVERQNIKVEKYEELEAIFAEQGVPLTTDILMGLPGSTFESFKGDLQHCLEREVTPRTMEIIMLPNSPMNNPSYREKWELVVDEDGVLVGCSTYSSDDYKSMSQLRLLYRALDHFGILRHLLQFLQWERGIRGVDFMDDLNKAVAADGGKYPLLSFVARQFDIYTAPPVGWDPFFEEVEHFIEATYGITVTSDIRTLLDLQKALMPFHGREFPATVDLAHDYAAYRRDRLAVRRGLAEDAPQLQTYPPVTLELRDPGNVCEQYILRNDYPHRRSASTGNLFWIGYDWELDSPFPRHTSTSVGRFETQDA